MLYHLIKIRAYMQYEATVVTKIPLQRQHTTSDRKATYNAKIALFWLSIKNIKNNLRNCL